MLLGMRILLVEDEFLLASELASYFSDCGATVLGPVSSVSRARRYIDSADGAVLDIDLNGETVFPLADELTDRGIPFVFFSGNDQITLPERFRYTQNLSKPAGFRTVAGILAAQSTALGEDNVFRALPKLRLSARLLLGDPQAADRLVERTLKAALEERLSTRHDLSLSEWLNTLMEEVLRNDRSGIMN